MSVLIRGVRRYGEGARVDVLVDDGQIADIGPALAIPDDADVIDATGQILLPGFVDLHAHLREPGREYAVGIDTGSAAVTVGLAGTQLTEMGMMAAGAGQVRIFSDDGQCVYDPLVMRRALEYATGLGG